MAVRKMGQPPAPAETPPTAPRVQGTSTRKAASGLPTKPKSVTARVQDYTFLIYGREKIGKTTLCASIPGAIFFSTEPGTKGLPVYEYNDAGGGITSWDVFRQAVADLEACGDFPLVVIDTADRAYDMALDWVCRERGIEYPGQDASGSEDYGKSWKAVKTEFTEQIQRIVRTGRGVVFTSHAKEQPFKTKNGDKFDRVFPTMSGQCRAVVEPLVDFIIFCDYAKNSEGENVRVLMTQGDDSVWAGGRTVPGVPDFPRFLPLRRENGFDILARAFAGEDVGLDPATMRPAALTTGGGGNILRGERAKAVRGATKK